MRTKYIFANYAVHHHHHLLHHIIFFLFSAHSIVCCNCKFTNRLLLNGNKMMKNEDDMFQVKIGFVSHLDINLHCCASFYYVRCVYLIKMPHKNTF